MMNLEFQLLLLIAIGTLGFISLCNTVARVSKWVWMMFLRPPKDLKRYGSWALITGSTDGIGRALAVELASKGLNLVLVGRDPLKLEATSEKIRDETRNGLQVGIIKTIVIDFSKLSGEEIAKRVGEGIEGLDVGILINNAGLAYPYAKFFHEVDLDMGGSVVGVNIVGTTWVTKAVIPGMLKKTKGLIVNMGSGSSVAVSSYPLYTIYAATKAYGSWALITGSTEGIGRAPALKLASKGPNLVFVDRDPLKFEATSENIRERNDLQVGLEQWYVSQFSRSINLEYKQHGIDVQCQIPLLVATKMASIKRSSFFIPSPETYSRASVRAMGYEQFSVPYWPHSLQWCLIRAVPDALLDWCLLQYFLGMRNRGLKKQQQKASHLVVMQRKNLAVARTS